MTEYHLPYEYDSKYKTFVGMAALAGATVKKNWRGASLFDETGNGWVYVGSTDSTPSRIYPSRDPSGLTQYKGRPSKDLLSFLVDSFKAQCSELEEYLEDGIGLSDKDLKRLDKAVTVMKVGFKIMKKVALKKELTQLKEVA